MAKSGKFFSGTFASLSVRNYRLYFIGQAVSLCGTWMQTIGQSWLVLKMTNSGVQLGLVTAAQFLPILFLGPLGGVIADRYSKRKLLLFTQSAFAVLALILGLLVATKVIQLWEVYVLAIALGFVQTVDTPTRQTFVIEMVGKDMLQNAISLNSGEFNLARVVGPAIGGSLILFVGIAPCFIINAISYIAVIIGLFMMNPGQFKHPPMVEKIKGQLTAGFRYVRSNPLLFDTLVMMAIIGTLSYEFSVILPLFAQFTFHGSAGTYAALTVAMGVGSIIGALYTATRKVTTPKMLVMGALLFGLSMLVTAVAPNLILALLALILVGFFSINFTSVGNVTLQLESTAEMRGRVMALWAVTFLGSTPIGGPIIGWIGQYFTPRWGLATGGLAAIFASGIGYRSLIRIPQSNDGETIKEIPINTGTKAP